MGEIVKVEFHWQNPADGTTQFVASCDATGPEQFLSWVQVVMAENECPQGWMPMVTSGDAEFFAGSIGTEALVKAAL